MRPLQILILAIGLILCVAWTFLTWAGSSSGGQFYAYPVTLPLFGLWLAGWTVVLVPAIFVVRRLKKK